MTTRRLFRTAFLALAGTALFAAPPLAANDVELGTGTQTGAVPLRSIGPMTFGDDGVLFVGDSTGAAVFAIDTGDQREGPAKPLAVENLERKLASFLGTTPDGIEIHDLAVNPLSKTVYLSITRGQGDVAQHVIASVNTEGDLGLLDLTDVRYARADLSDAPAEDARDRRGRPMRREALTDLEYQDGALLVTGLSNEEFSSKLRKFTFPWTGVAGGTSVEIFHGAHGKWETHAPVRTMTFYDVAGDPNVLAAYTCTPLVRFPLSDLAKSSKVTGSTIAELGNRNRPLDMFVYQDDGRDFLLMANSSRGVMKVDLARIGEVPEITEPVADKAGLPYETIEELEGVVQLARYGKENAVVLSASDDGSALRSIALP